MHRVLRAAQLAARGAHSRATFASSAAAAAITLLDGGTGRELKRIGAPFRQPEWSALALMQAPHYVRQVHDRFIAAGSSVITTNSYAIVPFHIGQEIFDSDGSRLATLAGSLARDAAISDRM